MKLYKLDDGYGWYDVGYLIQRKVDDVNANVAVFIKIASMYYRERELMPGRRISRVNLTDSIDENDWTLPKAGRKFEELNAKERRAVSRAIDKEIKNLTTQRSKLISLVELVES